MSVDKTYVVHLVSKEKKYCCEKYSFDQLELLIGPRVTVSLSGSGLV